MIIGSLMPLACCFRGYDPIVDADENGMEMQLFAEKLAKVKHLNMIVPTVGSTLLLSGIGLFIGGYWHDCTDCEITAGVIAGIGLAVLAGWACTKQKYEL